MLVLPKYPSDYLNASMQCSLCDCKNDSYLIRVQSDTVESVSLHRLRHVSSLDLSIRNKVIDHTWPSTILTPKAQSLILHGLLVELQGLIPHILVDGFGKLFGQVLCP